LENPSDRAIRMFSLETFFQNVEAMRRIGDAELIYRRFAGMMWDAV
jgi:hypothetical protein